MAQRYLWGHFSQLAPTNPAEIAVIERGDGCHVWDSDGRRYLDGLAGLFTVQAGHGRTSIAQAMAAQAEKLAYFPCGPMRTRAPSSSQRAWWRSRPTT
ncbi:MAG: aminotransferase class III-fold pyridoxal phosphate-dependent enzyme [Microthrixaceae bacterium]|nr:aminotransferase class III-fold pyridoxal phosphate-dependent enzyme [Microthrixaceae bacterium]